MRRAVPPHESPDSIAVLVEVDQTVVADASLEPRYACVALTVDDWC